MKKMKTESSTINSYVLVKKQTKFALWSRIDEIKNVLLDKITELKLHIFVKNEQYNTYNSLKNKIPDNVILVHFVYSENN